MKKLSSIILAIAFFAILVLPSFYIPINKASPEKEVEFVEVEKPVYVTPPVIDLPEVTVEAKMLPKTIYVEVPKFIPVGDTIIKYLPMPYLTKLEANVYLLEETKPDLTIDLIASETQENHVYTAMWP